MNNQNQLNAAIAEKEEYLDFLGDVQFMLERSIERDLKLEMGNRFFIGVGKFFIVSTCVALCGLQMYAMCKYLGPYILPHLF